MSRAIANAANGCVFVRSVLGKGSVFGLSLPFLPPKVPSPELRSSPIAFCVETCGEYPLGEVWSWDVESPRRGRGASLGALQQHAGAQACAESEEGERETAAQHVRDVLVIEDDPLSGQVVSAMLDRLGYRATLLTTGADALKVLCPDSPCPVGAGAEMKEDGLQLDVEEGTPGTPVDDREVGSVSSTDLQVDCRRNIDFDTQMESGAAERGSAVSFCCVLMDMGLPDTDGLTLTMKIRDWEKRQNSCAGFKLSPPGFHIPIIAITAYTLDDIAERYPPSHVALPC